MNLKHFAFEVKSSTTAGQFTGRASVYGNVDAHNDVVMPGAFQRTLRDSGGEIVVLSQHDPSNPIGKARLIDRVDGLWAEGQLVLDLPTARDAYVRLKSGLINGISIGYEIPEGGASFSGGIRQLHEIKLWEISLVTFPANQFARVTDVKHHGHEAAAEAFSRTAREAAAWAKRHRQKHMNGIERFLDNLKHGEMK